LRVETDHMGVSKKLEFLSFNNTRDLGGMKTADGRIIAKNRLIRSGNLHAATESDIKYISENVGCIVDLRTETERSAMPDPDITGVENIHLSILPNLAAGVSRDKKSDDEAFFRLKDDPDSAGKYMAGIYLGFVLSDHSVSMYRRFIDLLLAAREKALLWHCTVGKDRTGIAAVIIQEILGVDRADIMRDYLLTNDYIRDDQMRLVGTMGFGTGGTVSDNQKKAFGWLFGAHKEYLFAFYEKAEELYGSFDGFLSKALKVTDEEREILKANYLVHEK